MLEKGKESPDSDLGFGEKWQESSVKYDPNTCSWKTHRCLWEEDLTSSSVTLPKNGMMRDGVVYRLRTLERPIAGTGSGWLPTPSASSYGSNQGGGAGRVVPVRPSLNTMANIGIWQTPVADDAINRKKGKFNSRGEPILSAQVKMWPTPTVNGNYNKKGLSKESGDGLATAVKKWPTPCAMEPEKNLVKHEAKRATTRSERGGGNGPNLATAVKMFPTPTKSDGTGGPGRGVNRQGGDNLRTYVDNFPTPTASEDAAGTPRGKMQRMLGNCEEVRGKNPMDWAKGTLNPEWVEGYLMAWPRNWTSLEPLDKKVFQEWLNNGEPWSEEPSDLPRVLSKRPKYSADRIKAIGNGQVPICAATAWRILS